MTTPLVGQTSSSISAPGDQILIVEVLSPRISIILTKPLEIGSSLIKSPSNSMFLGIQIFLKGTILSSFLKL
jgi:hypothetical protein